MYVLSIPLLVSSAPCPTQLLLSHMCTESTHSILYLLSKPRADRQPYWAQTRAGREDPYY